MQNRSYYKQMRNQYFERAKAFGIELKTNIALFQGKQIYRIAEQFQNFIDLMKSAHYYAKESLRGYQRKILLPYSEDKKYGVLEEEVIFLYFIEEIYSSSIYLKNRIESDIKLKHYRDYIKSKEFPAIEKGFLANILSTVKLDELTEEEEIIKMFEFILKRFEILSNIYSIIKQYSQLLPEDANR